MPICGRIQKQSKILEAITLCLRRYDFVEFMQARLGETCGSTVVGCMQIMSGHEEGVARLFKGRAANQQKMAMKEQTTHAVDREFLDNAILSEVLCSLVLFVVCGTCSMLTTTCILMRLCHLQALKRYGMMAL